MPRCFETSCERMWGRGFVESCKRTVSSVSCMATVAKYIYIYIYIYMIHVCKYIVQERITTLSLAPQRNTFSHWYTYLSFFPRHTLRFNSLVPCRQTAGARLADSPLPPCRLPLVSAFMSEGAFQSLNPRELPSPRARTRSSIPLCGRADQTPAAN